MSGDQISITLLKALPAELAEQVLKRLAPDAAERLRLQLLAAPSIPAPADLDQSLTEFFDLYRIAERGRAIGALGEQFQNPSSPTKPGAKGAKPAEYEPEPDGTDPIESLRSLPMEKMLKVLEGESPAAITLILSVLEPANAAIVLGSLPASIRSDVAIRFTRPGDRNYALIKQLAKAVTARGRKLEESTVAATPPEERIADLAMMLRKLPRPDRVEVLQTIDTSDADLGQKVREKLYRFDDVLILDDRSMQKLLAQMNLKLIAMCLKGASEQITTKMTNNISARARDLLQEEMSLLGSLNATQVEEARKEFLAALRQAEEQGTISIGA